MATYYSTVIGLLVLVSFVGGQQGQHPLTNIPSPGDVLTSYVLPDHPSRQFPAGEQIPILLGFHNSASRAFNLSYIMGSINLPDNNYFVQNFTHQTYFVAVKSKEEVTFEYSFQPDKSLRPMELRVALTAFYFDAENQGYASTFFNETIDIVEKPRLIDYELLWMYCVMLALAAGVIYALFSWIMGLTGARKGSSRKQPRRTAVESGKDDWLAGTNANQWVKETKAKKK